MSRDAPDPADVLATVAAAAAELASASSDQTRAAERLGAAREQLRTVVVDAYASGAPGAAVARSARIGRATLYRWLADAEAAA